MKIKTVVFHTKVHMCMRRIKVCIYIYTYIHVSAIMCCNTTRDHAHVLFFTSRGPTMFKMCGRVRAYMGGTENQGYLGSS